MASKLDFYQQKLSGQANKLRDHLQFLEDSGIGLGARDRDFVLDYLTQMDEAQKIFASFATGEGPDLTSERVRFEMVQNHFLRNCGPILGALGGRAGLHAGRPAGINRETHPWWYIDLYLAEKQSRQTKRTLKTLGVVGAIVLVLIILLNTVFKPDPIVVARAGHLEDAISLVALDADYVSALGETEQSLALDPNDAEVLVLKAIILEYLGQSAEAEKVYAQASDVVTAPEQIPLLAGRFRLQFNEADKAIALAEEAIDLNPNFAEAWFLLGQAYDQSGDTQRAFDTLSIASDLALEQDNSTLYAIIRVNMGYLAPPPGVSGPQPTVGPTVAP